MPGLRFIRTRKNAGAPPARAWRYDSGRTRSTCWCRADGQAGFRLLNRRRRWCGWARNHCVTIIPKTARGRLEALRKPAAWLTASARDHGGRPTSAIREAATGRVVSAVGARWDSKSRSRPFKRPAHLLGARQALDLTSTRSRFRRGGGSIKGLVATQGVACRHLLPMGVLLCVTSAPHRQMSPDRSPQTRVPFGAAGDRQMQKWLRLRYLPPRHGAGAGSVAKGSAGKSRRSRARPAKVGSSLALSLDDLKSAGASAWPTSEEELPLFPG